MLNAIPHQDVGRLGAVPTANGGIARAACARARHAGIDVRPLLDAAGLSVRQLDDPKIRIAVANQIRFLNLVARALQDDCLGMRLAQAFDLRELGMLYYVPASSATLGDALQKLARYSTLQNEGVRVRYRVGKTVSIVFEHVGVARVGDDHQIEFFVVTLLRLCRQLGGRQLSPDRIRLMHRRTGVPSQFARLFGCSIEFGEDVDEIEFPGSIGSLPLVSADPYLDTLLTGCCEQALANRRVISSA